MAASVIPGGSFTLRICARKSDGSLVDLTGAAIETQVIAGDVATEAAAGLVAGPDKYHRDVIISGAQTRARSGKVVRVRTFVTPLDSPETPASETTLNVKA